MIIQVQRPDNKPDNLGLSVLDEPCAQQSDPTVLDLLLRNVSKQANLKAMVRINLKKRKINIQSNFT